MTKPGDCMQNPDKPNKNICLVLGSTDNYIILVPFTNTGYPSTNQNLIKRYHKSKIKLTPAVKMPHLMTCPNCLKGIDSPLRWPNIYKDKWNCKLCKKVFTKSETIPANEFIKTTGFWSVISNKRKE